METGTSEILPFVIIAVDGGAASGKSSTSRLLAARFHLLHVDTGSHYRAVTHVLLQAGIPSDKPENVQAFLREVPLDSKVDGNLAHIQINHQVPSAEQLRSDAVNQAVSHFAALPEVRKFLFDYQRAQAQTARRHGFRGIIMEGRDIGSVIFPDADLRIFLEADPETRARRRQQEGQSDSITTRDRLDSNRKTAPLRCPEGAIRIDTSELSLEEVVERISGIITQQTGLEPISSV